MKRLLGSKQHQLISLELDHHHYQLNLIQNVCCCCYYWFLFLCMSVIFLCVAPCVPKNANGRLDCVTNSAWVTWDASAGAHTYVVSAEGAGGHNSTCTSTSSPCNVPDLQCATLYTFHVTAVNEHCRSNQSSIFELETGIQQRCNYWKIWCSDETVCDFPPFNETLVLCRRSLCSVVHQCSDPVQQRHNPGGMGDVKRVTLLPGDGGGP